MRRGAVVQGGRRRRSQEARPSGPRSPWPCTPAVCSDLPMRPAGHTCSPACLPRNLRSCAVPCCPGSGCPWAPASLPPRPACPQGAAGPCLRAWRPGAPGPRVDRRGCRCRPQGHPCPAASGESPGGTLGPRTLCLAPRHSHGAAPSPPYPRFLGASVLLVRGTWMGAFSRGRWALRPLPGPFPAAVRVQPWRWRF